MKNFRGSQCTFKITMVVTLTLLSVVSACGANTNDDDSVNASSSVVQMVNKIVHRKWAKISTLCAETLELEAGLSSLPEKRWIRKDQRDQRRLINQQIKAIRKLLLTTTSQKIMRDIDRLDNRIADVDAEASAAKEILVLFPEKEEKVEKRLEKLRDKREKLEKERAAAASVVMRELESLGLRIPGQTAEHCLFTVNMGDIIDNTVIAKGVGTVVANLGELMKSGDIAAARRYYGMYVVMMEVQKACFDDYLSKSRNGVWRKKLAQIKAEAEALAEQAANAINQYEYTSVQRVSYQTNYRLNRQTVEAVDAYEKVLDAHEEIIARKADAAEKMLKVAQNSFSTLSLANDFFSLVKANQDSFDALVELNLPQMELFNDSSLQAEILALTKKLKE